MDQFERELYRAPRRGFGWLFPTQMANARASRLQRSVAEGEATSTTFVDEASVGIATIHTRQDLVVLISMQEAIHKQLVTISRGIWLLALLAFMLLTKDG